MIAIFEIHSDWSKEVDNELNAWSRSFAAGTKGGASSLRRSFFCKWRTFRISFLFCLVSKVVSLQRYCMKCVDLLHIPIKMWYNGYLSSACVVYRSVTSDTFKHGIKREGGKRVKLGMMKLVLCSFQLISSGVYFNCSFCSWVQLLLATN